MADMPPDSVAPAATPLPDSRSTSRGCHHWQRRLLLLLAGVLIICGIFHARLMTAAAGLLIVDEPGSTALVTLILDGDKCFDLAADRVADRQHTILLFQLPPGRLERMGIVPTAEEISRRELLKRKVPEPSLVVIDDVSMDSTAVLVQLCEWMRKHPGTEVDVLCDRFSSRKWDLIIRRAADSSLRRNIHLIALPNRSYDETNWWKSKPGLMAFVNGFLRLGFQYCSSSPAPAWRERTEIEIEAAYRPGGRP